MKTWIRELADHYEASRRTYQYDKLIIVFDIDGTILDSRHVIHLALKNFDTMHCTEYFKGIDVDDIDFHEEDVGRITKQFGLSDRHRSLFNDNFFGLLREAAACSGTYRSYDGVFEVIGLLQKLPNTYVGLNTGRPEMLRFCTLQNLNSLGRPFNARFADELLFMQPNVWSEPIKTLKRSGIEYFRTRGYRVIAFFDNEPENLGAVSQIDPEGEILLLHAETIFKSSAAMLPGKAVRGSDYNTADLLFNILSPNRIEYAWQCNFERKAFSHFIESNIGWLQIDLKDFFDTAQGRALRHFDRLLPSQALSYAQKCGKGIKVSIHSEYGNYLLLKAASIIDRLGLDMSLKWFTIGAEDLRAGCLSWIRDMYPFAIIEFSVDHLITALMNEPRKTRGFLEMLNGLGVTRFSVKWENKSRQREIISLLKKWGFAVHCDNVDDFKGFLQSAALSPCSLTVKLSSADWKYFGYAVREGNPKDPWLKRIA